VTLWLTVAALVLATPGAVLCFWQLRWGRHENARRDKEIRLLSEQASGQRQATVTARYLEGSPVTIAEPLFIRYEGGDADGASGLHASFRHDFEIVCAGPAAAVDVTLWLLSEEIAAGSRWGRGQGLGTLRSTDPPRQVSFTEDGFINARPGVLIGRWSDGNGPREERLGEIGLRT
jgi:hypothetical protein